jgi:hypothetical protein
LTIKTLDQGKSLTGKNVQNTILAKEMIQQIDSHEINIMGQGIMLYKSTDLSNVPSIEHLSFFRQL